MVILQRNALCNISDNITPLLTSLKHFSSYLVCTVVICLSACLSIYLPTYLIFLISSFPLEHECYEVKHTDYLINCYIANTYYNDI